MIKVAVGTTLDDVIDRIDCDRLQDTARQAGNSLSACGETAAAIQASLQGRLGEARESEARCSRKTKCSRSCTAAWWRRASIRLIPKVQAISEVVNAFYAEKTRDVLQKMQDVLSKIET